MKLVPCLVVAILLGLPVLGSLSSHDREVTHLAHYTPNSGLSQSSVLTVLQDSLGFLWFGTEDGLNRFDGLEFEKFNAQPQNPHTLSDNVVLTLFEGDDGKLWIGTKQGGLNLFDRDTETFQRWNLHNQQADLQLEIRALYRAPGQSEDTLWIGTRGGGLVHLNVATGTQRRYETIPNQPESLSNEDVWTIAALPDHPDVLWLGTSDGLNRMDLKTGHCRHFNRESGLRSGAVFKIIPARGGGLWLGGPAGGLQHFDTGELRVDWWSRPYPTGSFSISSLVEDPWGNLWTGSAEGLFVVNRSDGDWKRIVGIGEKGAAEKTVSVTSLYWDRADTLWIGTWNGVYHVEPRAPRFGSVQKSSGLSGQNVRSLLQDSSGSFWVGTDQGLNRLDQDLKHQAAYRQEDNPAAGLWGNFIWILWESESRPGVMWIGTNLGLNKLELNQAGGPAKTRFVNPRNTPDFATGLGNKIVVHLYEAPDLPGKLWVGLARGLAILDLKTEKATLYPFEPGTSRALNLDNVRAMIQDSHGFLWLGGEGTGLHRIPVSSLSGTHPNVLPYDHFTPQLMNPRSLSHGSVSTLMEDRAGNLWVGTYGGGLNLFKRETGGFTSFTTEDGLSNNVIHALLEDDEGDLWISTNLGLNHFHPDSGAVKTYDVADGIQGNEFNRGSGFALSGGTLVFGGTHGLTYFKPEWMTSNPYIPPVLITGFSIHNVPVVPDPLGKGVLKKAISMADEVVLNHRHKLFSFEFRALNYIKPRQNRYAYKLEGFDGDWHPIGHRRNVTFTNLSPGRYTLKVKAANNDGVWNSSGTRLTVRVKAAPWAGWWAKSGYVLLIIGATISAFRWRITGLRRQKSKLEREVARRTAQIQQQKKQLEDKHRLLLSQKKKIEHQADDLMAIDRAKSRFFANISHEFRTPLTLIQAPLTAALDGEYGKLTPALSNTLAIMGRHTRGLQRLIDQLLDLARLESGQTHLNAAPGNFVTFLKAAFGCFISLAQQKDIQYRFSCTHDAIEVYFDPQKMESVIANLISNAFKFTPPGGHIFVEVRLQEQSLGTGSFVSVLVGDSGIGIPEAQLPRIFDRFYQGESGGSLQSEGCGIGLALVREYVSLHGGTVEAGNRPRQGALFQLSLPLGSSHLDANEIRPNSSAALPGQDRALGKPETTPFEAGSREPKVRRPDDPAGKQALLIVEDHPDLRTFLGEQLRQDYRVFLAENGCEGLRRVRENKPDLIICDVMMPEMDGYDFVRHVRALPGHAHIPIVLLTALADPKDKLEGFSAQADAFITKPFSSQELKVRVASLLATRDKVRKSILYRLQTHEEDPIGSTGSGLLERMHSCVLDHLAEPDFTVEELAGHMAMSKRNLERRIKDVTGMSAGYWVRNVRLDQAHHLLKRQAVTTVSEVALASGFQNGAYFSRLYQKAFGQRPLEELKQRTKPVVES